MPAKTIFMMEEHGGKLRLCKGQKTPYDVWVSLCDPRQVVRMTLQEQRHPKTNPQLGYWFACVCPFIRDELLGLGHDTLDFGGNVAGFAVAVATTTETVDMLLKALFSAKSGLDMMSKTKYTDEQMANLIDFTHRWAAEKLQVAVPPPNTGAY